MATRTNKTKLIVDELLAFALILDQLAFSLAADIKEKVLLMERNLTRDIAVTLPRGFDLPVSRLRVLGLFDQLQADVANAYNGIRDRLAADLLEASAEVIKRQTDLLDKTFGPIFVNLPKPSDSENVIASMTIGGNTLAEWWAKQATNLNFKIAQMLHQAASSGEGLSEILKRLGGTKEFGFKNGLETQAETAAETIARTGTLALGNNILLENLKLNGKEVDGVQQISVLDSRTSQICLAYAYKIWKLDGSPVGHDLPFNGGPPRHPNCRSIIVPVVIGESGIEDFSVDDWLDLQTSRTQNKIIGKGKADMFRAGKISVADLVDQRGHPLRLKDFTGK